MQTMFARVTDPITYQGFPHFITHAAWDAGRIDARARRKQTGLGPRYRLVSGLFHPQREFLDPTGLVCFFRASDEDTKHRGSLLRIATAGTKLARWRQEI